MPSGVHRPGYNKEYRARNLEKIREYNKLYLREWRKKNREKMRAYDAKWRAANPEAAKECDLKKGRKYYKNNYHSRPEIRRAAVARAKRWMLANPERNKELRSDVKHRRRALEFATSIGPINYKQLRTDSNGLCGICRNPLGDSKTEYDHIIPLARGGGHTQDNLQLSHPQCNRIKNARLPEELELSV